MTPCLANRSFASAPASWCSHRPTGSAPILPARSSGAVDCISSIAAYRLSVGYAMTAAHFLFVVADFVAATGSTKLAASFHRTSFKL